MRLWGLLFFLFPVSTFKIIIVPGMGGSKIYNDKNYVIWPPDLSLKLEDLNLHYSHENKKHRLLVPPVRKIGNIDDIRIDSPASFLITKNVYYSNMIKYLVSQGHDLFSLSYDFRYVLHKDYYEPLYQQFVEFFETNGDTEPFLVVCHSLGGLIFHHFLSTYVNPSWYKRFIKKIYFVNVPWGGTPISFITIQDPILENRELEASASAYLLPFLNKKIKTMHLFDGFYLTLPVTENPFFRKGEIWYNTNNIHHLFKHKPKVQENYQLFQQDFLPIRKNRILVPHHLVSCLGKNTTVFMDHETRISLYGDGDGLLSKESLLLPHSWGWDCGDVRIPNMEHAKVNSYTPFLNMISENKDSI